MTEAQAAWGARIKQVRHDKHLKAAVVARTAGISRGYLHELERGTYCPSDDVKLRLAAAIGEDPRDLFDLRAAS